MSDQSSRGLLAPCGPSSALRITTNFTPALALAHYHLGELDEARKQLKIAQDTSTTPGDLAPYTDALARIASGRAIEKQMER